MEESLNYCKLDCIALFEVLTTFNELVFNQFSVNVHKSLTLPSLAMRVYKSKYMPQDTIYQLNGQVEEDIRQSYTGGAVDVYIPHNDISDGNGIEFETLYQYDANSLFPTIQANEVMPIGKPITFEGNIRLVDPDAFGFFYCDITTPDNLEHPILQRKVKTVSERLLD